MTSRASRAAGLTSFSKVPFVAAGAWYLCMLSYLLANNGSLRWKPDVVAFGLGTAVIGIPVAFGVTYLLAVPAYLVCRQLGVVSRTSAVAAGLVIGFLMTRVAVALEDRALMEWWIGPLVGLVSALFWWRESALPSGSEELRERW